MDQTWSHPELGTFNFDEMDGGWVGTVKLPSFAPFRWDADRDQPAGEYMVQFESENATEPAPASVAVALAVIRNEKKLPALVTQELWDEFNGRGGSSGMWWEGALNDDVEE